MKYQVSGAGLIPGLTQADYVGTVTSQEMPEPMPQAWRAHSMSGAQLYFGSSRAAAEAAIRSDATARYLASR